MFCWVGIYLCCRSSHTSSWLQKWHQMHFFPECSMHVAAPTHVPAWETLEVRVGNKCSQRSGDKDHFMPLQTTGQPPVSSAFQSFIWKLQSAVCKVRKREVQLKQSASFHPQQKYRHHTKIFFQVSPSLQPVIAATRVLWAPKLHLLNKFVSIDGQQ